MLVLGNSAVHVVLAEEIRPHHFVAFLLVYVGLQSVHGHPRAEKPLFFTLHLRINVFLVLLEKVQE